MKLERSDIEFPLWRKKVDSSILEYGETPIPRFLWKQWNIEELFSNAFNKHSTEGEVKIKLENKIYRGAVYFTKRGQYKFSIDKTLRDRLKRTYVMSYMRFIESKLRKGIEEYEGSFIEEEIPFWEFLDIEFDSSRRIFLFYAHYVQKPEYLELFREIINSHILFDIEAVLAGEDEFKIAKGRWRSRSALRGQIDAKNVIYNLIDIDNKEFYIGEAESLKNRLSGHRSEIPNWTHYRFDSLPNGLTRQQRVAIERLLIRTFASFLPNSEKVDSMNLSDYQLKNKRIDN